MNLDIGEVVSRAWQISWKHKSLWLFGILLGLIIFAIFPLAFAPTLLPIISQDSETMLTPVLLIIWIGIILLFFLASFPLTAITHASVTLGALHADQEKEKFAVGELTKKSLPFVGRVLGVMLLFAAGMMLINLIIQAISFFFTIVTLGFGSLCLTPLFVLMYPAFMIASAGMEQAISAVIVDNMKVMDAAKKGWDLVRANPAPIFVLALVIYLGVGIVTGIIMLPMFVSLFALPFGFMEQNANWTILSIALGSGVVFIPMFLVFNGWALVFMKSVWVLTYLRLTRGSTSQPVLLEAAPS